MPFIDIFIFAIIAIFLIFRLRSILGGRDGFEQPQKRQNDLNPGSTNTQDNVISFSGKSPNSSADALNGSGIEALQRLDPTFRDDVFINGAKAAFPMILASYADGDLGTLRRFLGYDLYEEFSASIHQRDAAGEDLKIEIESISDVQLLDAEIIEGIATVTVQYTTIQSRTLLNSDNTVIEDESVSKETVDDIWSFERDIQSADPNWKLVETSASEDIVTKED